MRNVFAFDPTEIILRAISHVYISRAISHKYFVFNWLRYRTYNTIIDLLEISQPVLEGRLRYPGAILFSRLFWYNCDDLGFSIRIQCV